MDTTSAEPSPAILPRLVGERVTLRPGASGDAARLHRIQSEPSVARWWGEPESIEDIAANLGAEGDVILLVVEVDGLVVGGIQYTEEADPMYRHAGIDVFLSGHSQGRGLGVDAVSLLVNFLITDRKHHRLIIDPAVANERAIRCYAAAGFRPVGIMRQYERGTGGRFHDNLLMDLLATDLELRARPTLEAPSRSSPAPEDEKVTLRPQAGAHGPLGGL